MTIPINSSLSFLLEGLGQIYLRCSVRFSIFLYSSIIGDLLFQSSKMEVPWSIMVCILGSKGILPMSGPMIIDFLHLNYSHILEAPPEVGLKIQVQHLQLGQTNPLIFSTTPIIGILVFKQKLSSFLTSAKATSCGVVTIIAPSSSVHWMYCARDRCSSLVPGGAVFREQSTVDDQVVQISPAHLLQELLDQSVFTGASPNHGIILVADQEADRHHCKISGIDGRPAFSALVDLFADHPQHGGNARPADVHIQQSDLEFLGEKYCQLRCDGTLAYSSFAGQHQDFVLHILELVLNDANGGVNLVFTRRAFSLIGAAFTGAVLASSMAGGPRAVLVGIFGNFFIHQ